MSERVWHKGPPPHVGWWESSSIENKGVWRWWDGERWSLNCRPDDLVAEISRRSQIKSAGAGIGISWTDYWPENARVPRLDPTGGHWTFNADGRMPRHAGYLDLAFRSGATVMGTKTDGDWRWSIEHSPFDILAWRPAA
ncbi:hypothetical protein [Acidovorax phage AP1]|nr:hypothetical protein [Acidovorax phage AP1]